MSKKELSGSMQKKLNNKRDEETRILQSSLDKFTFRTIYNLSTVTHNRNVCES